MIKSNSFVTNVTFEYNLVRDVEKSQRVFFIYSSSDFRIQYNIVSNIDNSGSGYLINN